ncbi:MAG: threonine--tRNA ligase [Luteolibacter sp.]
MHDYRVRLSLRDPDIRQIRRLSGELGQSRSRAARRRRRRSGCDYTEELGEAAFYGPKIDFVVKDVIGRDWQLGTVQVDYNLPERFKLSYIGADNQPHTPVMIHRAPFGSLERFTGLLIEHFEGKFPAWLAPEQVRVLPISDKTLEARRSLTAKLADAGVRVTIDRSSDKIGAKIRNTRLERVPYMLVLGAREVEEGTVSVRHRDKDDLGTKPVDEFIAELKAEIAERRM